MKLGRNKLSFVLQNFGSGELSFDLIESGNKLILKNPNIDLVGFYNEMILPVFDANFPCFPFSYANMNPGPLIITDLKQLERGLNLIKPKPIIFYSYDLDWLKYNEFSYLQKWEIYNSSKIILVARCVDHANAIKNVWNRKVDHIIETGDLEKFYNIIYNIAGEACDN